MKRAHTMPVNRASRTDLSDEVVRRFQREQEEILIGLVRIQSETLRQPPPPQPGSRSRLPRNTRT